VIEFKFSQCNCPTSAAHASDMVRPNFIYERKSLEVRWVSRSVSLLRTCRVQSRASSPAAVKLQWKQWISCGRHFGGPADLPSKTKRSKWSLVWVQEQRVMAAARSC